MAENDRNLFLQSFHAADHDILAWILLPAVELSSLFAPLLLTVEAYLPLYYKRASIEEPMGVEIPAWVNFI